MKNLGKILSVNTMCSSIKLKLQPSESVNLGLSDTIKLLTKRQKRVFPSLKLSDYNSIHWLVLYSDKPTVIEPDQIIPCLIVILCNFGSVNFKSNYIDICLIMRVPNQFINHNQRSTC